MAFWAWGSKYLRLSRPWKIQPQASGDVWRLWGFPCTGSKNNRLHSCRFTTVGSERLGAMYGCFRGLSQNSPTTTTTSFSSMVSLLSPSTRLQMSSPPPLRGGLRGLRGRSQVCLGSAHRHLHGDQPLCHHSAERAMTKCMCRLPWLEFGRCRNVKILTNKPPKSVWFGPLLS